MINAQQWAQNWVNGLTNATDKIRAGVNAVTNSPAEAAVNAIQKMRAHWLASIDSNYWSESMLAVSTQDWKTAMLNKGLPRIADGARASQGKVQNYATRAIPIMQNLQNQVRAMPKVTPQDSEARVLAWMRGMRAAQQQLAGH